MQDEQVAVIGRVGREVTIVHQHGVVVGDVGHLTHIERAVLGVVGHAIAVVWRTCVQRQVHLARTHCCVGIKGDILLAEGVVAVPSQLGGDILPPFVKFVVVEQRAYMNGCHSRVGEDDAAQ